MPERTSPSLSNEKRIGKHFDFEYLKTGTKTEPDYILKMALNRLNLDELRGGAALDVGCGTGNNAIFLAKTGIFSAVDGLDLSEIGVQMAEKRILELATDCTVRFEVGNFLAINRTERYSLIVTNNVLEYVSEPDKIAFIQKLMDLTTPGGINIINFVYSLPKNFLEEVLGYKKILEEKPLIKMFAGSDNERPITLAFESNLAEFYRKAGWTVLFETRHASERNFVNVNAKTIIAQKPLNVDLPKKRD